MRAAKATTEDTRCLKCRRPLRRPSPDGLGPKCRRKVRRKARTETTRPSWQTAKAAELLELGAVVPLRQNRVFLVVSDDGTELYRTAATGQCNCPAGLKSVPCYHALAAMYLAA
ncbi:SWIM zinc finger family protein [Streptomyces sp. NPDC005395]|uniref:SWIM zinc finger family protein n=1 Tax=unclassified Streptomyces TaxID=2593676 RepID=UPI001F47A3EB|nr:SWIM zinc finger family protein [Streptomyces sp. BSE6.1]